jgi:hypothetical protein
MNLAVGQCRDAEPFNSLVFNLIPRDGIVIALILHRFFHWFHPEDSKKR